MEVEQELEEKHLNFIDIYQDGHSFKTRTTSKSAGDFSSRSTVKELSVYLVRRSFKFSQLILF